MTAGYVDLHSHLVPAVDDGVRTLDDAEAAARALCDAGFARAATTPHIYPAVYPNDPDDLRRRIAELSGALSQRGVALELHAGAEHFYGPELVSLIEAGRAVSWGGGEGAARYFLMEVTHHGPFPLELEDRLFRWRVGGLFAILAHPERYESIQSDRERARRLADAGVVLQVDLTSLGGKFGRRTRKLARWLCEEGLIHIGASDMHGAKDASAVADGVKWLRKRGLDHLLLVENPSKILRGEAL